MVIEEINANQTFPTDPKRFAYFGEMNGDEIGGALQSDVVGGLPSGVYRMSSMLVSPNHQPIVVGTNQHGAVDDIIYVGWILFGV